jgi:hypothetical protein
MNYPRFLRNALFSNPSNSSGAIFLLIISAYDMKIFNPLSTHAYGIILSDEICRIILRQVFRFSGNFTASKVTWVIIYNVFKRPHILLIEAPKARAIRILIIIPLINEVSTVEKAFSKFFIIAILQL